MELIELTAENIEQYLDDCLSLQRQLIKPEDEPRAELFKATANDGDTYMLGVLDSGRIIGLGVLGKLIHPAHITAHVDNVVVDVDERGKGYFTVIMDALEAKAKAWGADEITLTC